MSFEKENKDKDFVCKQCGTFWDIKDLEDGKCPTCGTDEDMFINDSNERREK